MISSEIRFFSKITGDFKGTTMGSVALVKYENNITRTLEEGLNLIGGFGSFKSPIIIKPNICTMSDSTGSSVTDVKVVESLIELLLNESATLSIKIVETDSQSKYADEAFEKFGYKQLVKTKTESGFDVSILDLSRPPFVKLDIEDAHIPPLDLAAILFEPNFFISVAVAKTHENAFITGALKNQFGLLPRKDQGFYHSTLDGYIVDLNRFVNPNLCIVDARVGVEGWNGPKTREIGCFIIGRKPVSVDATMARIMGFEPDMIPHLIKSSKYDLGTLTPEIRGQNIESVRVQFDPPF